jgi:hypothetical protein
MPCHISRSYRWTVASILVVLQYSPIIGRLKPLINWQQLKTVVIDGWNFVDLYNRVPVPSEQIFPACQSLALKFGGDGLADSSMYDLLVETPIDSLALDSMSLYRAGDLDNGLIINELVLKNLRAEVTNLVLSFCDKVEHLVITNCSASTIEQMPAACNLTLQNIGVDQCIGRFIRTWCGTELHVMGCPRFDDDVLRMMGKVDRYNNVDGEGMEGLYI